MNSIEPTSTTARRLRRHEQPQVAGELAGHDDLLLVAAGELARGRGDAGGADVVLLELLAREGVAGADLQGAVTDERRPGEAAVEHEVLGDRELADQAIHLPVLGDEAHPGVEDLAHGAARRAPAIERDRAGHVLLQSEQRLGELGLAVALDAGDREHLAAADGEADVVDVDEAVAGRRP